MGAAFYIVLEQEIPGLDTRINGKMLSRAAAGLRKIAKRLGLRPLPEFVSVSGDEVANLIGEEEEIEVPAVQWFSADEGLRTVDALLEELDHSADVKMAEVDLLGCQRILREAQKQGIRWRLAVDF